MKIAIVSQPFDAILPPFQNSVGYYSWNLALQLAHSCDVTVFGHKEFSEEDVRPANAKPELHLIPSALSDRAIFLARKELGELIQIHSPISTSNLLFPEYGRRVASELSREKFDVIHVQHCSQYLPIIRKLNPKAKIVLHMHAEWFSQSNFDVLRQRLRHADRVFAVSDHIRRKTEDRFPEVRGRIETIYCAIDVQEFGREKDYAALRRRKQKRILYCGAVSAHKGPHVLLDAFRMVAARDSNVCLEFVGSNSNYPLEENFDLRDKENLKRMAPYYAKHPVLHIRARLGLGARDAGAYQAHLNAKITPDIADKVTFRGFIHRDVQIGCYYDSDIFAFPPVWEEGCGIPPIEAMAAGMPVVGSRSGGLLETVKDGETGFLVEKNDAAALAYRILQLVRDDDLREQMGRSARLRALSQFNWKRIAGQVEAQYRMAMRTSERHLHAIA